MTPTARELAILADLVRERVLDGALQKVQQPSPSRFVFSVHRPGVGKTRLLVDLDPRDLRFHPTEQDLPNPEDAPALCRQLRRLLQNGRIRSVEADGRDRIVSLAVDRMEDGAPVRRRVVLELIPTRPALFVVGPDGVVEAASGAVHSAAREVARGRTYEPPPPPDFTEAEGEPFRRFDGARGDDLLGRLDAEVAPRTSAPDRGALRRGLTRALKRQAKRVGKVEQDLRKSEGGEELAREGELLKAALGECRRGMEEIRVRDWEAEGEVWKTVSLDPTLDPQENLARIFRQAKKKIRSRDMVAERLEEQRARLAALHALERRVEDPEERLEELLAAAEALEVEVEAAVATTKKKREAVEPRKPWRAFVSKDGLEIRVGRGARENDELTFRHARGNEWWLHAQDYAGSHVVVKTEGELPEQTLLDAATLAVLNSKAADQGKQAVSYTRRKYVTKFRGAAPGKVMLQSHKTVVVRMEPERIARLLGEGRTP